MVLWSTHRYILSFICEEKNEIGRSYVLLLLFPHQRHEWLPWLLTRISFLTLDRLQFHVKGVFDSPNDIDEEKSQDKKKCLSHIFTYKPTFKSSRINHHYSLLFHFRHIILFFFFLDRLYAINHSKSSIVVVVGGMDGSNTCTVVVVALLDCLSQEIWVLFSYWHLARASLGPKTPLKHEKRG